MPGVRRWLPLLSFACAAAVGATGLVGQVVPPYPQGLRALTGSCVGDTGDPARACDWSIESLADAGGRRRWVVAGSHAGDDGAIGRLRITDAIAHPPVAAGFDLQSGTCRVDGVEDARVVAVVRIDFQRAFWGDATWARRLDLDSGRLVELDPARVDCLAIGD